jgi:YVTN family beta-propeller protein
VNTLGYIARNSPPISTAARVRLALALSTLVLATFSGVIPVGSFHPTSARAPPAGLGTITAGFSAIPAAPMAGVPHVRPDFTGIGSILSTIDPIANQSLPGDAGVSPQLYPEFGVYDSANGQIYLRNSYDTETAVGVLSTTTGRMVADLTTPGGETPQVITPTIAIDTKTGFLYATNAGSDIYPGNVSIIDPSTDQVMGSIPVGYTPNGIAYDPANNELYVANEGTHNVTVISGADNRSVANITTPNGPSAILFDPATNQVFTANYWAPDGTVTVISTLTNTVVANVTVGTYPFALALDTVDDYVDVLNQSTDGYDGIVTEVQAGSSPSVVGTLTVGPEPEALTYDPINDQVYVANDPSLYGNNVSVFNQSTGLEVANIFTGQGPTPLSIAYDPVGQDVYVSTYNTNNVSIINTTSNTLLGAVSTYRSGGLGPLGVVVDPATGNVYTLNEGDELTAPTSTVISVTTHEAIDTISLATNTRGFTYEAAGNSLVVGNAGGNNTYYLNASTYSVDRETPAGQNPEFVAYDSVTGTTYTFNPRSDNVTAVNATGQAIANIPIGVGVEVQSMDFDSYNGNLYVVSEEQNVTVINGSTNTHLPAIRLHGMEPWGSVYDPHNHDLYVANYESSNVTIINSTDAVIGSIPVGANPITIAFDPENNTVWVACVGGANLTVLNDTTQTQVFSVPLSVPANELQYDPANNAIYNDPGYPYEVVAYNASTYAQLAGGPLVYTTVSNTLGSMGYDPVTHDLLIADLTTGAIYVIGAPPAPSYAVSFVESGLPSSTPWSVTLNGTPGASGTNTITFSEMNGTSYAYTVGTVAGYLANITSGTLGVNGHAVTIDITFTPQSVTTYFTVDFVESGLPATTEWNASLHGVTNHSTSPTIAFTEPNGTDYAFSVPQVGDLSAVPNSGTVPIDGHNVLVPIRFLATSSVYPVEFQETGLLAGTGWNVTLNGTLNGSSTDEIGFTEPNGTDYQYTVEAVAGYSAVPSSGNFTVSGENHTVRITFTAVVPPSTLTVTLVASPATIVVQASTTLIANASGGVTPYTFAYAGLPAGCLSSNTSRLACTPTASGTFHVSVTATDPAGGRAVANATLTVTAASTTQPPASPTTASMNWGDIEIGLVVLVIIAAIVLFLLAGRRRRRKPEDGTSSGPSSQAGSGPSPPSN